MCGSLRAVLTPYCSSMLLGDKTERMVSPGSEVCEREENILCTAKGASWRIRDLGLEGRNGTIPFSFF